MYFNKTLNNSNDIFFNIKVWRDNNGVPGEEIYSSPSVKPQWSDHLYEFYPYMLEEPLILSGTFYVGWQQQASGSLNIGFDSNNDSKERIFYRTQDTWYNSVFPGSLLIRPIIGKDLILGEAEVMDGDQNERLLLFPNPTSTQFTVDQSSITFDDQASLSVFNLYGGLVHQQTGVKGNINIAHLAKGMYVVTIVSNSKLYTAKLLIN
jgi:hypothetical protein